MDLTLIAVYSEITTMMDNILENTLANKDQGPNWIRLKSEEWYNCWRRYYDC